MASYAMNPKHASKGLSSGRKSSQRQARTEGLCPHTDVAKNGAYAKACTASGADSVVATRYRVEKTSYVVYGTIQADIKGLPAKVSKVELVDADKMPQKKTSVLPLF